MATITDTLQTLAQDLRDAVAAVRGVEARVKTAGDTSAGNVTNIINTFNARPLQQTVYVDPANGNDANDGSTYAKARKTLDAVFTDLGTLGLNILLFGNDTVRKRHNVSTNITIQGVQPSNDPIGYTSVRRTIGFLGLATNSPSTFIGTYSAGWIFDAGRLLTFFIDWALPEVPAGLNTRAHIASSAFVSVLMLAPTITVANANAAALFGSFNNGRLTVTIDPALGAGAAGKLFLGIAAGADPNTNWVYQTNVKSA